MSRTAFCLKHSQGEGFKKGKVTSTTVCWKQGRRRWEAEADSREWPRNQAVEMKPSTGAALISEQQISYTREALGCWSLLRPLPPISGGDNHSL